MQTKKRNVENVISENANTGADPHVEQLTLAEKNVNNNNNAVGRCQSALSNENFSCEWMQWNYHIPKHAHAHSSICPIQSTGREEKRAKKNNKNEKKNQHNAKNEKQEQLSEQRKNKPYTHTHGELVNIY